jgi:3-deoxy-D-manno-octulosonic-acid transferase
VARILGHTVAESLAGRRDAAAGWLDWRRERRGHPLIWLHAASVGEALTADPVLRRLRTAIPAADVMLTHTSPSVSRWPHSLGADHVGYLPPGDRRTMDALFSHLQPVVVVFARSDLWPGLVAAARRHSVPAILLGGTVRPGSTRLLPPVRAALRRTYARLRWAGAVSPEDADRLRRLGVPGGAIHVTGDPRHDQILERSVSLTPAQEILRWTGGDPVLVAGSTEPDDEEVVLRAYQIVAARWPCARLVIAAHEPAPDRTRQLLDAAHSHGLHAAVLGPGAPEGARVLLYGGLGSLADLYLAATMAYVGGGLRKGGLHTVAEPAAWAVPVMFGDCGGRPPTDASRLEARGGGVSLPLAGAADRLAAQWIRWLDDPASAHRTGLAARGTLRGGAADETARAILQFCRKKR